MLKKPKRVPNLFIIIKLDMVTLVHDLEFEPIKLKKLGHINFLSFADNKDCVNKLYNTYLTFISPVDNEERGR